ncbi:MAG TPA: DegT/DnrJ/EryC1/StrS family aminotransferase [Blastococcus sp.]|nr:DegT/DnrJ/EryC1/StrS family aminotransferase [Blastococcus sp.]
MSTRDDIPLSEPSIGELEFDYVADAVRSGYVSSVGAYVSRFEDEFASAVGAKYAVACATGTAALHVALQVVGVGAGDEVAVADFTFIGSVNPVVYLGGEPLLVDSERETWNLDPELLLEHLTERLARSEQLPKAVEVVHVLGQPARIEPLLDFCAQHGVPIVEDAAESLGARWTSGPLAGRHTGVVGTIGAFSFNGNKIATTGGGGMIVTDDPELARRARHLTTQAKMPDIGYLHDEVGYNYRLTNLAAALGVAQLERLPEFVQRKAEIADRYDAALRDVGVVLPPRRDCDRATYWLYSVLMPDGATSADRDRLLEHLSGVGIQARALWRPLHLQPPFVGARRLGGDVGEDLFTRGVSLPCSTTLRPEDQERVVEAVLAFFGKH